MDQTQSDFAPNRRLITSRTEYDQAVDRLLQLATAEILIFDPDCAQLRLNAQKRCGYLQQLLTLNGRTRVTIIVHQAEFIERQAPRLLNLLRLLPEQCSIRVTGAEAKHAQDCFIVIDNAHCVRRPVAAQPRGVWIENDPIEISLQRERFTQLLAATDGAVHAFSLGL